jgi:hypothetical protein
LVVRRTNGLDRERTLMTKRFDASSPHGDKMET